ncbi:MAG TPA: magnesium transporter [Parachlamydiales bacterium]|nr:MAG: magnesium transporter [Chlamydiae bacterium GWF2_49_8]OGN57180.1 MAG: magnesium transporter [Chlamydiae bacterium RIFCSPHIGHO2_02_FULL_49_29]OGN62646.1 MAG: magnesium transporter [Chlamydiae bacterium RIFCSPHIGHO2_12_FULL_49_32]OGN71335.1 MAG: magnesium transporter [Chlamydiae bacterium RIFCSPLOWO2_12_FULL_49_12]HAZ15320.1 magnesium transporter [Parachlamydiales bacterium]
MESKTQQLDDILIKKFDNAFHKQTSKFVLHDIAKIACEHEPIDLAFAASRLPPNIRPVLFENLADNEARIAFMVNTDNTTRGAIFRQIKDHEIKKLIERMPVDEAVTILEDLPERRFRRVVDLLDFKKASRIKEVKKHQRNTAGRLMTNEFFAFQMDVTIGEAAGFIRDNPGIDLTRRIFVLNQSSELQGYVPARNMIVNPPDLPLRKVMRPVLHKVTVDASREEVVDIVERYKISALPVVDMDNFLVGVITYEDVVETIEDIADETIARMAGTGEKVSEHEPMLKRFFARAPWLLATLCAGMVSGGVMSSFQKFEGGLLTFVLFFVPLIMGTSGNIGLQCSTVLVRGMATGLLSAGTKREALLKEILIGMMTGSIFGAFSGLAIFILLKLGITGIAASPFVVALMVGLGLIGACIASTLLGVFSPLFFARLGVDPAVAAGPVITAVNDFLSMSIYFLIAMGLSSLFFS